MTSHKTRESASIMMQTALCVTGTSIKQKLTAHIGYILADYFTDTIAPTSPLKPKDNESRRPKTYDGGAKQNLSQ